MSGSQVNMGALLKYCMDVQYSEAALGANKIFWGHRKGHQINHIQFIRLPVLDAANFMIPAGGTMIWFAEVL